MTVKEVFRLFAMGFIHTLGVVVFTIGIYWGFTSVLSSAGFVFALDILLIVMGAIGLILSSIMHGLGIEFKNLANELVAHTSHVGS